ncbi:hypothetical protein LO772_30440 [Yinghuangia sp. ASG 101]|uniref:cyclophilin-like fold protein n=1 Tax=Yinghuangia sp. ASG 101 TaxID=2896848 RepID=UPI001E4FD95F|nr:cyclophilin-like fold protein [Yinghuangia sp. ASG 101]UGQ11079.1 hypothetical protein LO772_30440 [Yinghuangia sp. ASG 101]
MIRFVAAATTAALLLTATACTQGTTPAADATARTSPTSPTIPSTASLGEAAVVNIRVTLDGQPVTATLNTSPAARDLASLLPLTLDLEDFHETERIGSPPRKLTTEQAPEPAAAEAGDIAYYAPWGNLAFFYRDGPPASADLLILGRIDTNPDRLARAEHITIEATP